MSSTLAYTEATSGYRLIQDGSRYDRYFPAADRQDAIIIRDGEVEDTVDLMKKVVWRYVGDTKRIAPMLQRSTVKETCQAIWDFVYTYIQYQLDKKGLEQLRRPARTWADRKQGVDCDCMSIFVSSILTNLQVPHSFRITKYSRPSWQHVYVVVPTASGSCTIIDGVVSRFDYEKPYSAKKDYNMDINGIDVAVLSGYDEDDHLSQALLGLELVDDGDEDELGAIGDEQQLEAIYQHLVHTRSAIAQNPTLVVGVEDPQGFLNMLDYAIQYWHTDKRNEALEVLARYENQLNVKNGFAGCDLSSYEDDEDDDLEGYDYDSFGFVKPKKLFRKLRNTAKKVNKKALKTTKKVAKKVGKGAAKVAKKVGKAVLRFNPLSIAARAGLLLAMRLNLKKMGTKLKWAYATQEQAAAKGISAQQWQKSKNALAKVEKIFASKLQGKKAALRKAVLKGRAGNLSGAIEYEEEVELYGLGIAPAAALAAAVPIITAVLNILKKDGMMAAGEDTRTDNLSQELDESASAYMQDIESDDPDVQHVPNNTLPMPAPANTSKLLSTIQKAAGITQQAASAMKPVKQLLAKKQPQQATQQQATAVVPYNPSVPVAQYESNQQATGTGNQQPGIGSGSGMMSFVKANPIPSLVIGAVGAFIIYKALSPKPAVNGLDGLEGAGQRKRRRARRTPAKQKPTTKRKPTAPRTIKLF